MMPEENNALEENHQFSQMACLCSGNREGSNGAVPSHRTDQVPR